MILIHCKPPRCGFPPFPAAKPPVFALVVTATVSSNFLTCHALPCSTHGQFFVLIATHPVVQTPRTLTCTYMHARLHWRPNAMRRGGTFVSTTHQRGGHGAKTCVCGGSGFATSVREVVALVMSGRGAATATAEGKAAMKAIVGTCRFETEVGTHH